VRHEALAGELRGAFRLRVGDYRIIYSADHEERLCKIHSIGHRRDVYR
jgi:mRNA interferase RelE/StbE